MNDLVENCRITGDIMLDGQDIYRNCDVNLLPYSMVFKPNPFPVSVMITSPMVRARTASRAVYCERRDRRDFGSSVPLSGRRPRITSKNPRCPCPAVSSVSCHRACACRRPGGAADGRADLCGSRSPPAKIRGRVLEAQKGLYYRYGNIICSHPCFGYDKFFLLGDMIEVDDTEKLFSMPSDKRTGLR